MLRLTVRQNESKLPGISAEGRLVGEWADLLEIECAKVLADATSLELDLGKITDVDVHGLAALRRLRRGPVTLTGCTPIILALLAEESVP